ncbi:MAG: DUF192 domain-containing protein [Microgenomates group bacterium]
MKKITVGRTEVWVEIAKTPQQKERGLSGRDFLPENQGMIFVFEKPDFLGFWMKGMKFPLDFVWIKDNKVVEISENIKPEDFQPPRVLQLKIPVDKVLEVNAGFVKKYGIIIGDELR